MKTKISTTLKLIPAIILLALCFTSCDDDDYGPMGSALTSYDWELYSVNNMPVTESDVVEFQFYPGRYDYSMNWYTVPITWDMYNQGPYISAGVGQLHRPELGLPHNHDRRLQPHDAAR